MLPPSTFIQRSLIIRMNIFIIILTTRSPAWADIIFILRQPKICCAPTRAGLTNTKWSIWITIITAICMRCLLTGRFQPTVCRYTPMCRVISAIISSRITTLPVSAGIIRCIRAFGRSLTIRWGSCLAACRR